MSSSSLVPADPKSQEIQEIAAWAVAEYNKQKGTSLKLEKVLAAEKELVSGWNYYLDLEAADGGLLHNYYAKVYDQPWTGKRELEEFRLVSQDNSNARIAVAN